MLVFNEIRQNLVPASCIAHGMFDGVHIGHQKVILDAVKRAEDINALSIAVSFKNHPQSITAKTPAKLITSLDKRLELFEELGVQAAVILDFNEELSSLSAQEYLDKILIDSLNMKSISIGYDHRFGAQKKGDVKFLEQNSSVYNFEISVMPPVKISGQLASSSDIRKFISIGDVTTASELLGRPFSIKNKIIYGQQRGRMMGFPTINLQMPDNIIEPAAGVYSGIAEIENKSYYSVVNIGKRPTFGDLEENLIEAHLLNFSEDVYGKEAEISFLRRIRDEKKFSSMEELQTQIKIDCELATTYNSEIV